MEEQWVIDRARLRELMNEHPDYSHSELAKEVKRSKSWVKKWRKRLSGTKLGDDQVLHRRKNCAQRRKRCQSAEVIERVLAIRDKPPENLQRTPGPRTILYYLAKDEALKGKPIPRSTRTIWQILRQNGRIAIPTPRKREPMERPAPMEEWQADFTDAITVEPDPEGKKQHTAEVFNVIDAGSSVLIGSLPRGDYNAETSIRAITDLFMRYGRPKALRIDRDPRLVGSWSGGDFPSPFVRFLLCQRVTAIICPPHRPDLNAVVERFHRSLKEEYLFVHRPKDLAELREATQAFQLHYNFERPHQSVVCNDLPPREAFPDLPALPPLLETVDPDLWLQAIDGKHYKRRIKSNGSVQVDNHSYYVGQKLRGRYVLLRVDAAQQRFDVLLDGKVVKHVPIKGLYNEILPFELYLDLICQEAISDWRRWKYGTKRRVTN